MWFLCSKEKVVSSLDNTTSKGYVTFASLLGDVLLFAEEHPFSETPKQLLLFQTEGSETDGFYATVIRSKLDELGRSDIRIIAPKIEDLIFQEDFVFDTFWHSVCDLDDQLNKVYTSQNPALYITGNAQIMLN